MWSRGPAGPTPEPPVVVVGAGVSGLVTARELLRAGLPVLLLEERPVTGGVMARGALDVPGRQKPLVVDLGPESLLARRPEALELLAELGLSEQVEHPAAASAAVASRGSLHDLPAGTVMGVPRSTRGLLGLLDPGEVARVAAEEVTPLDAGTVDVDVASWVSGRLGRAVVDRLVEPLLGGVYAGRADRLSLRATVPALWASARAGAPLLLAAAPPEGGPPAGAQPSATTPTTAGVPAAGPVFAGVRGGVARLAEQLTADVLARGGQVRTATAVTGLSRGPAGWSVRTAAGQDAARAVVLAVPAPAAARLLADVVPAAAAALTRVRTASSAIGTLVTPAAALAGVDRSGVLVPPVEGRLVKAATFSSRKWGWLGADAGTGTQPLAVLRVSFGRAGEEAVLERDDADLLAAAATDLGELLAGPGQAVPVLSGGVTRWVAGLPQYDVGHLDLVQRVHDAVAGQPGLEVTGATYGGVGVPACIAGARAAARRVLEPARGAPGTIDG